MTNLTDRVVAITGASRGIGRAAAIAFADAGASVTLLARSLDDLEDLADEIGRDRALPIACDVTQHDDVESAVSRTLEQFGRLDVLVNNAGVIDPIARLDQADPDAWGRAIDVNLTGVFHGVRAAAPSMVEQGSGTIITISSGAAHSPKQG